MTRVFFVRHGQSDWRSGTDRDRGLTPEGAEDVKTVLRFFRGQKVDAFFCSPYRRSLDTIRETADFFAETIHIDERLREREAAPGGNCRELFQKRWADFDWCEPGGECLRSVQERNIAALREILEQYRDKTVVLGTHGTAFSTIMNYFDPEWKCGSFLRVIDWMPFVMELDFAGLQFLQKTEHIHVEKIFKG